jgi:hypothetical protein
LNGKFPDEEPESYSNEEGLTVFTAEYLLGRGYCCGYGCKNCPYDYINVKEPKRSMLILQKKMNESNEKE